MLSPSGRPVQRGKATASGNEARVDLDASEQGTYVVDWQVASADTHPARGQFVFSVGHATTPATTFGPSVGQVAPAGLALQALGRWLHFAGYALSFGTLWAALILPRLGEWPTQPELGLDGSKLWQMTNAGIVLLLLAEPFALLGETGSLGLDQMFDGDTLADALASPFGRLLGFRVAAALLLWVVSGSLSAEAPVAVATTTGSESRESTGGLPLPNRTLAEAAAVFLGLALAVVDGLGQHAASFSPAWLGLAVHALHLVGMSLWLGTLAILVWAWRHQQPLAAAARLALAAFGVVAITGVSMAFVHLRGFGDLVGTAYGQVLSGKQAVLLFVGVLAIIVRRRRAELAALTLLIGLASLMVSLPPPR